MIRRFFFGVKFSTPFDGPVDTPLCGYMHTVLHYKAKRTYKVTSRLVAPRFIDTRVSAIVVTHSSLGA
ncbi:hypothetical protein QC764_0044160 [Podospora pseudoanserina]|uniref:Uncharacterized protein n=1 Tax=Podospora pseudoanserina TaxID=2609844 RepID=A0ABR0IIY1_9PEZI|nr:hypothetical protein QC764_0044160 [Podospora pseudoanserina]